MPQGSVLGLLLFLLYINDVSRVLLNKVLKFFADGTNLFLYGDDLNELQQCANKFLRKLENGVLLIESV